MPHELCMRNGKLVLPPVTPLPTHMKTAAGIYIFTQTYKPTTYQGV